MQTAAAAAPPSAAANVVVGNGSIMQNNGHGPQVVNNAGNSLENRDLYDGYDTIKINICFLCPFKWYFLLA